MEFGLSEEQSLIADSLTGFLSERYDLDTLRANAAAGAAFRPDDWQAFAELGMTGLLVPEAHGGSGLGGLDAMVLAERMGYAAAPLAYLSSTILAPAALRDSTAADRYLPGLAAGDIRFTAALTAVDGSIGQARLSLDGDNLSGKVSGVIDSAGATHVLVLTRDAVVVCPADADGLSLNARASVDPARPIAEITFDKVTVERISDDPACLQRVLDLARCAAAAEIFGACQSMLDQAVAYTADRYQFNRPVASFQAVKHMCADMVTMLEPCRALVWYAGFAQTQSPEEATLLAAQAKAHLSDIGREVARTATEAHGGMGFTDLQGLHYWFKRVSFDRQIFGSAEHCRKDAARAQGLAA